jgi:DNA-binding response OmpR family regulator
MAGSPAVIRVLIVDDDPDFADALQHALLDAGGFTVRTVTEGVEALKLLDREHGVIDVVVVDLNLPDVNGFEVIGAMTRRKNVMGVLATTGVYQETYLEIAKHLGANVAIRKPEDRADLRSWAAAIRSIFRAENEIEFVSGSGK